MRWGGGPLLLTLVAVQIGLLALGAVLWARVSVNPPPPTFTPRLGVTQPTTLESASPVAAAVAADWLPEATLMHASLQIDWPWQAPDPGTPEPIAPTGWISYVYTAPWTAPGQPPGGASLSVLVERLSGAVAQVSSIAWASPVPDHPPQDPELPSLAAVAVAEAAGGTNFRHACPVFRHLTRVSLVSETAPDPGAAATPVAPAPPFWLVTYEDSRQLNEHGLAVRIDAATGRVLAVTGSAPEC